MNSDCLRRLLAATLCSVLLLTCPGRGSYAAAQFVARSVYAAPVSAPLLAAPQVRPSAAVPMPIASLTSSAVLLTPGRTATIAGVSHGAHAALAEAGPIASASPSSAESLGRRLEDLMTGSASVNANASVPTLARPAVAVRTPLMPAPAEPAPAKSSLIPKIIASASAMIPIYFFGLPMLTTAFTLKAFIYLALALPLAAMPFTGRKAPVGLALFANGLIMLVTGDGIIVGALAALGGSGFQMWREKNPDSGLDGRFGPEEAKSFVGALGAAVAVGAVWAGFVTGWAAWGTIALAAATSPLLLRHLRK